MAALKTQPNDASVDAFIDAIVDPQRQADCRVVLDMMERLTAAPAKMWGSSMVGFGSYRYRYASGRGGEWFLTGFAPRKQALTLYIMAGFDAYDALLGDLGKYKTGKSCLYVKKLSDIDLSVLQKLVRQSLRYMRKKYAE